MTDHLLSGTNWECFSIWPKAEGLFMVYMVLSLDIVHQSLFPYPVELIGQ